MADIFKLWEYNILNSPFRPSWNTPITFKKYLSKTSYKPEKPLHISITELSFYQILKHNSNNDIRNGK